MLPSNRSDSQSALFSKISTNDRRRGLANELVGEARKLAAQHRFFHWEINFPNVWSNLVSTAPKGGFDAVIGNPPYVRQELLGDDVKRALKSDYAAFDGMADLYVYFYEQGLRLLRPGGRLSYVVTNKWLKAGYAEALRELFTNKGRVEFIADFGHAKHFFPDADVFPSVVVVRKPVQGETAPVDTQVCVIPREAVPEKDLSAAVTAATYPLPRAHFTKESWTLEPPDVMALLEKIRRFGVPLAEYAGVKPLYGIKTGLNEAFLIDTPTRDRLVKEDPNCADIIKPYLRGQDIERWWSPWNGLWMIFARRGIDIQRYPSVKRHLEGFRQQLEPKPADWKPSNPDEKWPGRKEGSYAWYELQDSIDYWTEFQKPKIIYQELSWWQTFQVDESQYYLPNTAYLLTTSDAWLLSVLNAPVFWWWSWRRAVHGKDEALRLIREFIVTVPVPTKPANWFEVELATVSLKRLTAEIRDATVAIHDWLRHEFGIDKVRRALAEPHTLDADGFVTAIRTALPKSHKWSAAEISRLKQEYADTLIPARDAAAEILAHERKLSDVVNAAYGLTPEDVALMWRTAPPRMPLDPTEELRRFGIEPGAV